MKHTEAELQRGFDRYEKARKLNPPQWRRLHERNLAGEVFDDMIDALPPCLSAPDAQPVVASVLNNLAKRRIFDAIRAAYDLGYSDARNSRAVCGDSAPGYRGRDVEADHGDALLASLNNTIAQPVPPDLKALLKEALDALVIAEAGLADIGDADREPGDDLAWCEARAAQALELPRKAIAALRAAIAQPAALPVHRDFRVTETVVSQPAALPVPVDYAECHPAQAHEPGSIYCPKCGLNVGELRYGEAIPTKADALSMCFSCDDTPSQPAALPAYDVDAAIERLKLCGMTSNDVIVVELESIRAELLAAAGSKTS